MASSELAKGKKKPSLFKKFTAKHPKVLPRTFMVLFISGLLAGIIAFAVLLGQDPGNGLNQKSFIGFFDFGLIVVLCALLWYGFGPKSKTAGTKASNPKAEPSALK